MNLLKRIGLIALLVMLTTSVGCCHKSLFHRDNAVRYAPTPCDTCP